MEDKTRRKLFVKRARVCFGDWILVATRRGTYEVHIS
jgi:hypothetical protein